MQNSQSPLIQRDGGVSVSLAAQLDVFPIEVPISIEPIHWNIWFIWWRHRKESFGIGLPLANSHAFLLTLNIQGDAVGEDLLVVRGDAGQRLLVRLSAGHQNVVALHRERPVRVPVLSGGRFPRHARLPPVCAGRQSWWRGWTPLRVAATQKHTPEGCRRLPIGRHTGGHWHFQIGRSRH